MKKYLVFSFALFMGGCATQPDFDYDKSANFSQYKTYAWAPTASLTKNTQGASDYQISGLMEQRVRSAVATQMSAKGLKAVPVQQADILLNAHASVEKKMDVDTINTGYGAAWGNWGMGYGYGFGYGPGYDSQTTTYEYNEGTLVLDVIDHKSNKLVWRAANQGRLKKDQTPQERTQAINEAVTQMLSNYPPGSGK